MRRCRYISFFNLVYIRDRSVDLLKQKSFTSPALSSFTTAKRSVFARTQQPFFTTRRITRKSQIFYHIANRESYPGEFQLAKLSRCSLKSFQPEGSYAGTSKSSYIFCLLRLIIYSIIYLCVWVFTSAPRGCVFEKKKTNRSIFFLCAR